MLVRRQSLVFNSQASSATDLSAPQITNTDPAPSAAAQTIEPSPSPTSLPVAQITDSAPTPTRQPGAVPTPSASSTINVGTVVGACLGSFAILIIIIALVIWHTRRNQKSIRLGNRPKRDNWNKLSEHQRYSHRSSFESKPSLPPLSFEHVVEYPPAHPRPSGEQSARPQFTLPEHPYSSVQAITEAEGRKTSNPFMDPVSNYKQVESDGASVYSASSNPFESMYTPPSGFADQQKEGYARSPFFAPHPDSSVQEEKWGSVGKERNVQESFASKNTDKLGSLIAALDLGVTSSDEGKADRSMHGHFGRL